MKILINWSKTSFSRKCLKEKSLSKRLEGSKKSYMLYKPRVQVKASKRKSLHWLQAAQMSNSQVWGCSRMFLNSVNSSKLLSWKRKSYKSSSRHWLLSSTNLMKNRLLIMTHNLRPWHKPLGAKLLTRCARWKSSTQELRIIKKRVLLLTLIYCWNH